MNTTFGPRQALKTNPFGAKGAVVGHGAVARRAIPTRHGWGGGQGGCRARLHLLEVQHVRAVVVDDGAEREPVPPAVGGEGGGKGPLPSLPNEVGRMAGWVSEEYRDPKRAATPGATNSLPPVECRGIRPFNSLAHAGRESHTKNKLRATKYHFPATTFLPWLMNMNFSLRTLPLGFV